MSMISIKEIKVNPVYKKLVPRMNTDDDKTFDESIKEKGVQEKLKINQHNILLDGHSRYDKAIKYKIERVPYEVKHFPDPLLEKKYVIECNLQRRHLTPYQKVKLGIPLLEVEKQLAKKRKTQPLKKGKDTPLASKDANGKKGKSAELVSKKIGVSTSTLERGIYIQKHATKEQKQKLDDGKTAILTVYNQLTRKERNLPKVELPKGRWSVILMDLPIQFENTGVRGSSTNNYDTIPIDELKKGLFNGKDIRELFSDPCIIFGWFQASTIFEAKELFNQWGFKPITNIIWDKARIGTGSWIANRHEHLVIAIKGKMPLPSIRIESVQRVAPENRKHSSKPTKFYDLIEQLYPNRKYLDLFSRYKHNKKWTTFGNETEEAKEKIKTKI